MQLARALAYESVDWTIVAITQQPWLANAMNSIVHRTISIDVDGLLILDDDVIFSPEEALKLIRSGRSVVGGDYALKKLGAGMVCRRVPNGRIDGDYVECAFLGCGFSFYSRKALEDVSAEAPAYTAGPKDPNEGQLLRAPFHTLFSGGNRFDEDVVFFSMLVRAGHTPWLDTTIRLGHIGTHVFTSEDA